MEEVVVISDTEDAAPTDTPNINKNLIKVIDINTIMENRTPPTNVQPPPQNNASQPLKIAPAPNKLAKIILPASYLLTNGLKASGNVIQAVQIDNQNNIFLMTVPTNYVSPTLPVARTPKCNNQPVLFMKASNCNTQLQAVTNTLNSNNQLRPVTNTLNFNSQLPPVMKTPKTPKSSRNVCCEFKKRGSKIDLEGFSTYDRLGFYGSEEARAKRCLRILSTHIKVREEFINTKMCKMKKPEIKNVEIPNVKKRKPAKAMDVISKLEPIDNKRVRCKKSCSHNLTLSKQFKYFYEVKARLNQNECCNFQRCQIPVMYKKFTYLELTNFKLNSNIYFVNSTNVRDVDNIKKMEPNSIIYFINENSVITNYYMECLPNLKYSVTVIDESVYDKYRNINVDIEKSFKRISKDEYQNKIKKKKVFSNFLHKYHLNQSYDKN